MGSLPHLPGFQIATIRHDQAGWQIRRWGEKSSEEKLPSLAWKKWAKGKPSGSLVEGFPPLFRGGQGRREMKGGGRGRGNGEESGGARTAPPPATAKSEGHRPRKFLWVRPSVSTEGAGFGWLLL